MNLTPETEIDFNKIYSSHLGAFIINKDTEHHMKTANGSPAKSFNIEFINNDNRDADSHIFNSRCGAGKGEDCSYRPYVVKSTGNLGTLIIIFNT